MAINCQKIFETDYAIATTGNAGLSKVDAEWAKAKIGLFLFVQNDLVDSVNTIYGQIPNDWELCSD